MKNKTFASFIILALFAALVALYGTSCASVPYRASISYGGASASYDGKRVAVDVDAARMFNDLRGYSK